MANISRNRNEPVLPEYELWVKANSQKMFSLFEFIYGVMESEKIPVDLVWAVLKMVWPDFVEYRGGVFLKECFVDTKIDGLFESQSDTIEVEKWGNLLSLDGMFADLVNASPEFIRSLAGLLTECWQRKLEIEFPHLGYVVEVQRDDDCEEVCITLYRERSSST